MQESIFHKLSNLLWGCVVTAVVLLATYVSLGRYLSINLQNWQQEVLAELNSRLPFEVSAQRLGGEWSSFTPEIVLHGLELDLPGDGAPPLQLTGGRVGIDVFGSLGTQSLQVTSLQLDGLALRGELTEEGKIIVPGLTQGGGTLGQWLQDFLLNIEYVTLNNNRLELSLPGGQTRNFALVLHLARDGSERRLRADLLSTRGTSIRLHGEGLGNPFKLDEFESTLHLQMDSGDIAAVADLFTDDPGVWAEGELGSEFWLFWDRGEATLDMELSLVDAVVRPSEGEWSIPLDELSLQATLLEHRNRWTVYAADMRVRHQGVAVDIPRIQLDTWGDSLRLRTEALQLQPLNQLLSSMPSAPKTLRTVFDQLNLRGEVSALQMAVGDISDPLAGWNVEGNFRDLQVDSWSGAPGVNSGKGYFELSDSGGYVIIDSQQFTMAFPTVFSEPLYYDDFYGTLNLDWDSDSLLLHSGLITATASEGKAEAMFSLNIPFTKTEPGLEMGLLVGLTDAHSVHRAKYVPYTLNQNLLDWLSTSIGDGQVKQAGFVWRGSLRPGASALRTVQLMLDLEDTTLAYHPDWPAVTNLKGTVFIDDTNVSVWAEHARLYDSLVEHLSAEAWMGADSQMQLAVAGHVEGSAEDGLRTVQESLLGRLTGGVFSSWDASGELRTTLQLELNLADKKAPPLVDVSVDLANVDLIINPGRLPVTAIDGHLRYTSAAGFEAENLLGKLWGRELAVQIRQRPLRGEDKPFMFGDSAIEVAMQASVAASGLRDWLSVEALALASGTADMDALLTVIPGETSLLTLNTSLEGMALDLPAPWAKAAADSMPLELALPLGGDNMVLGVALGEDLSLHLDITGGGLQAAAVGLSAPPPELVAGSILAQGRAPLVDVQAWLDFTWRYLLTDANGPASGQGLPQPSLDQREPSAANEFQLGVAGVHAERLLLWGQEFQGVDFSLQADTSGWTVQGSTDWLQGEYHQPLQGAARLQLDYLDMDATDQFEAVPQSEVEQPVAAEPISLPAIDVSIAELRRGDKPAGALDFHLDSSAGEITAEDIVGNVLGMRLLADAPGKFSWAPEQGSRLLLPLQFDDIGDTFEQLGYARFLETETGRVDLDLQWPGSPADLALAKLNGALTLDLGEGRFLQTPGGAGALKVVEIVNLAGIVQRLSMSQMFESGLGFETMDGELFFHGGTLEVAGLSVRGSGSEFDMSGVSDIGSRSLDGELVATLPVANNLPWVAALTAGPAIAAGVFVVSKVFEKQVNRLSSGVYSIQGTWDEPEVKFDRIFDDEVRLGSDAQPPPSADVVVPLAPTDAASGEATDTSASDQPSS